MITVTFATETGNAEDLAEEAGKFLTEKGMDNRVIDIARLESGDLGEIETLVAIVSTWGDGEPPTDAEDFFFELRDRETMNLSHLKYAVLALGDTCYDLFCQFGKDLDAELERHGAECMLDRVDCDVDYEDSFDAWIGEVADRLGRSLAPV
ncbi:MAG: flavodoxin domain-containing protein [Verrucomicrobiales bacterium]|nr:flavodoxin domain-containing protein [Verrucomicrobiales bacterium]